MGGRCIFGSRTIVCAIARKSASVQKELVGVPVVPLVLRQMWRRSRLMRGTNSQGLSCLCSLLIITGIKDKSFRVSMRSSSAPNLFNGEPKRRYWQPRRPTGVGKPPQQKPENLQTSKCRCSGRSVRWDAKASIRLPDSQHSAIHSLQLFPPLAC